jgi:hypothetical protein
MRRGFVDWLPNVVAVSFSGKYFKSKLHRNLSPTTLLLSLVFLPSIRLSEQILKTRGPIFLPNDPAQSYAEMFMFHSIRGPWG